MTKFRSLNEVAGCLAGYDPDALPIPVARQLVRDFVTPVHAIEKLALRSALGRVLATDVVSPVNVPAHDNSAMDGYAVRGADLPDAGSVELSVVGVAYAGQPHAQPVRPGECVRIMTGAIMPDGADTVIPQEFIRDATAEAISVPAGVVRPYDNRRLKGEDLAAGRPALSQGKVLGPADIGLLASLGLAEVPVFRRVRVAFFSTGTELRSVGETLAPGCVYDSNRYTLHGMLQRLGCELVDMGVVGDEPAQLEAALRSACENADAVITSGGVSVGEADYTRQMMAQLGDVAFWRIRMRPGRPMAFGKIASNGNSAYLFGLPGNPVAVMVTFYFIARDALLRMAGANAAPLPQVRVKSLSAIRKKPGRTEYQRGILANDDTGEIGVRVMGAQGSGILRSMSEANCMIVLDEDQGSVKAGDMVNVVMFEGLVG